MAPKPGDHRRRSVDKLDAAVTIVWIVALCVVSVTCACLVAFA